MNIAAGFCYGFEINDISSSCSCKDCLDEYNTFIWCVRLTHCKKYNRQNMFTIDEGKSIVNLL